jgi:hypothetical protein
MLKHYIQEVSPQLFKKRISYQQDEITGNKALKVEAIVTSTISYNDHILDANEQSLDRINRYVSISEFKFIRDISVNQKSFEDAYKQHFIDTVVDWKLTDNSIVEFTIEDLGNILELANQNMYKVWLEARN